MPDREIIVFTDLDGTLLDHETYSYEPALPAINLLKDCGIMLILASSKTAAEMAPLRAELGFESCPAIVENGAGILEPNANGDGPSSEYEDIISRLDTLPAGLRSHFTGFSQMGDGEIVSATGLSQSAAGLAKKRRYSEPGLFTGSDKERDAFVEVALSAGLYAKQGGRFLTFSLGGDKVEQMKRIVGAQSRRLFSIALGDAPNDIAMLEAADIGVIIPNPAHDGIRPLDGEQDGRILRAEYSGPTGWNLMVTDLVESGAHLKQAHKKE